MKTVATLCCIVCVISIALGTAQGQPAAGTADARPVTLPQITPSKPLVQMAILLDTSGSMSGLIDQARGELWSIVNEFISARRNGVAPEVQVALFEYGKSSLSQESGYIRRIVPLTTDLDKISEELFALQTNGGDEYCGWVINEAVKSLGWSSNPRDLKVIFIAGNEPFTQGPVDYRISGQAAINKGIIVNTIHCGSEAEGIEGQWKQGALIADGQYLNINQDQQIVYIPAPQDDQIAKLNARLNGTYIPFGREGAARQHVQAEQDRNAMSLSVASSLQRAVAKASSNYANSQWDLVDAVKRDQLDLKTLKSEDLPEPMQSMTPEQRVAYIDQKAKERTAIQTQIQTLNAARNAYVAEVKQNQPALSTLGSAITVAIRDQAVKSGLTFVAPQPKPQDTADPNRK
ncbi:MAG: VWA domain-containing protein [Phycisphaerae bacterium]|nr:VWA domain-containing protein [Phycisphaerae bacterium]